MDNNKPNKVEENFQQFMLAAEIHQLPNVASRYDVSGTGPRRTGANPHEKTETKGDTLIALEKLNIMIEESIENANKNRVENDPRINRYLYGAYMNLKEAHQILLGSQQLIT